MTKHKHMSITALILAAGSGTRFGSDTPKQYMDLSGKPVIRHSIDAFLNHPDIDAVFVVCNPDHSLLYQQSIAGLTLPPPIAGGHTRQASVQNAINQIMNDTVRHGATPPTHILIHDGARPLISEQTISDICHALTLHDAVIPASPVTDTLKQADTENGKITATIDRNHLYHAQTPQGFNAKLLHQFHQNNVNDTHPLTDDAGLFEHNGHDVYLMPVDPWNIKITTATDMTVAKALLNHAEPPQHNNNNNNNDQTQVHHG